VFGRGIEINEPGVFVGDNDAVTHVAEDERQEFGLLMEKVGGAWRLAAVRARISIAGRVGAGGRSAVVAGMRRGHEANPQIGRSYRECIIPQSMGGSSCFGSVRAVTVSQKGIRATRSRQAESSFQNSHAEVIYRFARSRTKR
jgi:hypothetical protein